MLKLGGLVTVDMPYNEVGATGDREEINLGAAAWLKERGYYSPKVLKFLESGGRGVSPEAASAGAKALFYQMATTRGGRPNPLHAIAPGWTSLYHNGHGGLTAQPKHICQALASAIEDMHRYEGLDIRIIEADGESESVTLTELCMRNDIIMLAPPMPRDRSGGDRVEIATIRAEIASLKRERDEQVADNHISRLCHSTAEPLPIGVGEWQGEQPGTSASGSAPPTPARSR